MLSDGAFGRQPGSGQTPVRAAEDVGRRGPALGAPVPSPKSSARPGSHPRRARSRCSSRAPRTAWKARQRRRCQRQRHQQVRSCRVGPSATRDAAGDGIDGMIGGPRPPPRLRRITWSTASRRARAPAERRVTLASPRAGFRSQGCWIRGGRSWHRPRSLSMSYEGIGWVAEGRISRTAPGGQGSHVGLL